jgi:hypothetical protein
MSKLQIGVIIAMMVLLLAVAIIFWGSIASALCVLGLFLIPGSVAYKYLWINREDRVVDEMDPTNIIYNRHLDSIGSEDYD